MQATLDPIHHLIGPPCSIIHGSGEGVVSEASVGTGEIVREATEVLVVWEVWMMAEECFGSRCACEGRPFPEDDVGLLFVWGHYVSGSLGLWMTVN